MGEDAMYGFTPAELLWYYEGADDSNMNELWGRFDIRALNSHPAFIPRRERFEDRRDAFLRLVVAFLELGYVKLEQQWLPDAPEVPGGVAEQVEALRAVFPRDDVGMEMGELEVSWFLVECPFDVTWRWPRRSPKPLFPGHNPRYRYLQDWGNWDGVIPPEWGQWKFTPGRLWLDDFDSYEDFRAFHKAYPDYYRVTPRVERIVE